MRARALAAGHCPIVCNSARARISTELGRIDVFRGRRRVWRGRRCEYVGRGQGFLQDFREESSVESYCVIIMCFRAPETWKFSE